MKSSKVRCDCCQTDRLCVRLLSVLIAFDVASVDGFGVWFQSAVRVLSNGWGCEGLLQFRNSTIYKRVQLKEHLREQPREYPNQSGSKSKMPFKQVHRKSIWWATVRQTFYSSNSSFTSRRFVRLLVYYYSISLLLVVYWSSIVERDGWAAGSKWVT